MKLNLQRLSIIGLIIATLLMSVDVYLSVLAILLVCGIQQIRIIKSEKQTQIAKSESELYKGIVYDQLCRYKEALFNGKTKFSNSRAISKKGNNISSIQ